MVRFRVDVVEDVSRELRPYEMQGFWQSRQSCFGAFAMCSHGHTLGDVIRADVIQDVVYAVCMGGR